MNPKLTNSDETSIALISQDIKYIKDDIFDIKTVLREGYATKDSLAEVAKDVEKRLNDLESKSNLWRILNPIISAVLGSIMTFLTIQYLMKIK